MQELHCIVFQRILQQLGGREERSALLHSNTNYSSVFQVCFKCVSIVFQESSALLHINTNYCSRPRLEPLLSDAAGNRRGHDTSITRLRAVIQTSHSALLGEERGQKQRFGDIIIIVFVTIAISMIVMINVINITMITLQMASSLGQKNIKGLIFVFSPFPIFRF